MNQIDNNLYSRQIKTYGLETMEKLRNLRVLIVGMRGLGAEIAKNIILSGVKQVKINDENDCKINDLGSNFFLSEEYIGKPRDKSSLPKLKELNPYVDVDIFRGNLEDKIIDFDIIIITEIMNTENLFKINDKCHNNNVGFIYSLALGLSGFIFCDFGPKHIIIDPSGKEKQLYFVKNIDKNGVITIDQRNRDLFNLMSGKLVKFKEIEGIPELNDGKPRKINKISSNSFSIEDKYSYENYKNGGIIEEVILPKEISYKKLKEVFNVPYLEEEPEIIDCSKEGRNELLHCAFIALHKYFSEKNELPELNNEKQANEVLKISKSTYNNSKNNNEEWIEKIENFEENIILNVAKWSKSEISPLCSFLGGIVAQEIMKITGKYVPINQWLWFDFFESVEYLKKDIDRTLYGTRYDDQIAIYGQEFQKKLSNLNIFIIGAGALGCEYLKLFSLMGISNGKDSKTIITDNDLIEMSNLNRQFLFHQKDIGKSKSKIATEQVKIMNKQFNCHYFESFVNTESENFFDEKFWKNQNFIFTAVDSKSARKYIDLQCTKFTKILIDTGTLGTEGSCQVIVPFKTCCYNDNKEIPQFSIPLCTLHNFPSKIEHCIEWGLSKFSEFFEKPVEELKKFLENKEDFYNLIENEETLSNQINKLKEIKKLILFILENSLEKIIQQAASLFYENFDYKINKLLNEFPIEHKNKDGSPFWSGSKRMPSPIKFDIKDENCFNFVKYYSIILARSIGVEIKDDKNDIENIIKNFDFPEFDLPIKLNQARKEEIEEISLLKNFLNKFDLKSINKQRIIPEKFEKDIDSNNHVTFVNICTNLRAKNYNIPKSDEQKTKMIAGRIVPAIANTTASITGFASFQLLTLINSEEISLIKNCNFNTADNFYQINNPSDVIHIEDEEYNPLLDGPTIAVPPKWTVWDIINIKGPLTCQQFIDYMKNKYNVNIKGIISNFKPLIQMFLPNNKIKLPLKIEEIYKKNNELKEGQNCLWLDISSDIDNVSVVMPKIKYIFK